MTVESNPMMTQTEQRRLSLRFDLQVSIRYNLCRRAFFECWENVAKFLSLLGGSVAVFALLQSAPDFALWASVVATAISLLDVIINFSGKARFHQQMAQDFTVLLNRLPPDCAAAELETVKTEMHILDQKEGKPLGTLLDMCYNEQIEAEGVGKEEKMPIHWLKKWLANYI